MITVHYCITCTSSIRYQHTYKSCHIILDTESLYKSEREIKKGTKEIERNKEETRRIKLRGGNRNRGKTGRK